MGLCLYMYQMAKKAIWSLQKKYARHLRYCSDQLLNYWAHHKSLKVFCLSHNIFKTNLFNTLSYFHFFVFTSSLSNLHLIKNCLSYFQVDPEILLGWQTKIRTFKGAKGIDFYFDSGQRVFCATNNLADPGSAWELGKAEAPELGSDLLNSMAQTQQS